MPVSRIGKVLIAYTLVVMSLIGSAGITGGNRAYAFSSRSYYLHHPELWLTPSTSAEPTRVPEQTDAVARIWLPHVNKPSGGKCGESMTTWHPPVINGCATGHEHGEAPPQWVYDAGYTPSFEHPANTPNENQLKHTSFKGFRLRDDGVELYVIAHVDTNPSGHSSRFHSYQVWAKDRAGNVSHWRGWMDFGEGDMTGPQISRDGCDPDVRPIMSVFTPECSSGPPRFESWYTRAGGSGSWSWDFGFTIKANYFFGGDPNNYATWVPTGELNDRRRIEAAWYAERSRTRGRFYANQWGDIVSGPNDPVCGTQRQIGAKTYKVLCLEQYIAPTMTTVGFPNNSIERDYDVSGVQLPN